MDLLVNSYEESSATVYLKKSCTGSMCFIVSVVDTCNE